MYVEMLAQCVCVCVCAQVIYIHIHAGTAHTHVNTTHCITVRVHKHVCMCVCLLLYSRALALWNGWFYFADNTRVAQPLAGGPLCKRTARYASARAANGVAAID